MATCRTGLPERATRMAPVGVSAGTASAKGGAAAPAAKLPAAAFRPGLPAPEVDRRLREALLALQVAEKNAVLWFHDVLERRLYRELGFSSIHLYAAQALGFSPTKTSQFLRLCRAMRTLPGVKASLASGELPWTKAREVVKVATPETEGRWLERARTRGRRDLEREVARVRARATTARKTRGQGTLSGVSGEPGDPETPEVAGPPTEVPVQVTFRFTPEQFARYEALLEAVRKRGGKEGRDELVLEGLEAVLRDRVEARRSGARIGVGETGGKSVSAGGPAAVQGSTGRDRGPGLAGPAGASTVRGGGTPGPAFTRVHASPYQVVVHLCERCGRGEVATSRGARGVDPTTLKQILCDARLHRRGEHNRSTVPPSLRLETLARDGYRCRWRGCGNVHFINVHHIVPREAGGANRLDNLITLCSGCHRVLHVLVEKGGRSGATGGTRGSPPGRPAVKEADLMAVG